LFKFSIFNSIMEVPLYIDRDDRTHAHFTLFMRRALWAWPACWSALHSRPPCTAPAACPFGHRPLRAFSINVRSRGCQAKTSSDHPFNEALITVFITKGDYQSKPTTPSLQCSGTGFWNGYMVWVWGMDIWVWLWVDGIEIGPHQRLFSRGIGSLDRVFRLRGSRVFSLGQNPDFDLGSRWKRSLQSRFPSSARQENNN